MKFKLQILTIMAVVLCALLPESVFAQLDASAISRAQRNGQDVNLGGANPFDTTGEEGEQQQDSTKVRKMRKPLESYYFNDSIRALPNFFWNIDRDMNDML